MQNNEASGAAQKSIMGLPSNPYQENRSTHKTLPFIHLVSVTVVLVILIGAVIYCDRSASSLEDKYVHALAALELPQTYAGIVVQQAAFRQKDLLPVYGSSEMLGGDIPYGASAFFATYPTGFNVIEIAKGGNTSLNIAQDLAAIGPGLKGKKVVISFTPIIFTAPKATDYAYAGNFSRLHAASLAFSPYLSMAVKQKTARRMLEYPDILSKSADPILSFALQNLAGDTLYNHLLYALTLPLGQLDTLVIRLQDHYEVWSFLQNHPNIAQTTQRQRKTIDWNAEMDKAEAQQKAIANNNPFGIENNTWVEQYHQVLTVSQPGSGDQEYITSINNSAEWVDLAILLEILKELGAQPLILSRPINGTLSTASGISEMGRQAFYAKLQSLVGVYNMPLVDFQQYTNDPFFSIDESSHPSRKGWVVVDETLDAFFHGNIR
jgi:D-alanine transfer protein